MRKLASIQIIEDLKPISGADRILQARILGWNIIVAKNDFKIGDKCVFCEIDSILPSHKEWAKPLERTNYRVKTIKMRGVLSQGIAFPLRLFPKLHSNLEVDTDLTDILGITKYEPEYHESNSASSGYKRPSTFPTHLVPQTDETRIQSCQKCLYELQNKPYYISVKNDGSSSTYFHWEDKFYCCSRSQKRNDENDQWIITAKKYNLEEKLGSLSGFAIQAELCGPGIQKNRLKLSDKELFAFNVFNIKDHKYLDYKDFIKFCKDIEMPTVQIIETGDNFHYTMEELLEMADGYYENTNSRREGIVIRPQVEMYSEKLKGRLSFKVISNKFLLSLKD